MFDPRFAVVNPKLKDTTTPANFCACQRDVVARTHLEDLPRDAGTKRHDFSNVLTVPHDKTDQGPRFAVQASSTPPLYAKYASTYIDS